MICHIHVHNLGGGGIFCGKIFYGFPNARVMNEISPIKSCDNIIESTYHGPPAGITLVPLTQP